MTRKRRRLMLVLLGMLALATATALVLNAFQDNLVFFHSPSDIQAKKIPPERRFRLGGLVEQGSVQKLADGVTVQFSVTDTANSVTVQYKGVLPDLFREGQGVVTEGSLNAQGLFVAREVLARHDETYMPPEVAKAIKESGQWREEAKKP